MSNISSLLHSFSTVDFARDADEEIDPIKYHCAIKMNEFNKEQSVTLQNLLSRLKNQEISEDALLRKVLETRFQNINFFQRHPGFPLDMSKKLLGPMRMGVGATVTVGKLHIGDGINLIGDDYIKVIRGEEHGQASLRFISKKQKELDETLRTIVSEYNDSKYEEVRENFSSLVNDNMYVLTQIILGIYSLRSPIYFSEDTYEYIRASHSLWSLLEHVAKGADPFLLDDNQSLFDNTALSKEYEYYAICLLKVASFEKVPLLGLGCRKDRDYVIPNGALNDSKAILGHWSLPALPPSFQELTISRPGEATITTPTSVLMSSLSQQETTAVTSKSKSAKKREKRALKKKELTQELSGENPDVMTSVPLPEQPSTLSPLSSSDVLDTEAKSTENLEQNDAQELESDNSVLAPDNEKEAVLNKQETAASATPEHVFARWNRQLHPHKARLKVPVRTGTIPNTHLKVLQAIFEGVSKVTYHSFESLWLHLNGENSVKSIKKGTSHRRLLNSEGVVVGGTFALNGGKRQYSPQHLKELRDALTLVGYGQSYLSTLNKGKEKERENVK